jgi:hypothetical protein
MITPKSMGHVAILQRSIGYACGPVLMIPPRVKRFCFVLFKLSSQAAGCGISPASGCRVPALDVGQASGQNSLIWSNQAILQLKMTCSSKS